MQTAPSTVELASQLRLAITRAARRLRQQADGGLTPSMTSALAVIERHGPLTPSELASVERVQRPTITRVLARFEELALIDRAADPADGRSTRVSISPAGRALLHELRNRREAYLARRIDELDADDRATLDRATTILERMLEGRDA